MLSLMTAMISMLRGVNVGGHNLIKMDTVRALYESIGFTSPLTYVQSGNVVFLTRERNEARTVKRIEDAIEANVGFRPSVLLRSVDEMREVIQRNPFAKRSGIEPNKLLVSFLAAELTSEARETIVKIKVGPEEVKVVGRELYIYFPDGMGRSKLPPLLDKAHKKIGTGRNWNTVTKLLEMAEKLEAR
jgi:uncharacterized protein (DUF1697 family)